MVVYGFKSVSVVCDRLVRIVVYIVVILSGRNSLICHVKVKYKHLQMRPALIFGIFLSSHDVMPLSLSLLWVA